jgi:tctex1 domain-containing protein 2
MASSSGMLSPLGSRSELSSPRPKFDSDLLRAYMKKLLTTTLQSQSWPEVKDRDRVKMWIQEIGERVKVRMTEIQPKGL